MIKIGSAVSQLWKVAQSYPFRKEDFNTIFRSSEHFKPTFTDQKPPFVETQYDKKSK